MSTDTIYLIIAILMFPSLWLLVWILDRNWPSMSPPQSSRVSKHLHVAQTESGAAFKAMVPKNQRDRKKRKERERYARNGDAAPE